MKVWVFVEVADDKVTTASLEMLTKAREVGSEVEAIYAGGGDTAGIAASVGEYGATKLHVIDPGDGLPGQVAAAAIAQIAGEQNPDAIVFAQTYDGRDAIARLSVKLDKPVLTNGTALSGDGGLTFGTAIFGGVTLVDTKFTDGGPSLVAIRPKSFAAEASGGGAAEVVNVAAADAGRAAEAKVLERHVEEQQGPKLEEATVVVSGGRGIGGVEIVGAEKEVEDDLNERRQAEDPGGRLEQEHEADAAGKEQDGEREQPDRTVRLDPIGLPHGDGGYGPVDQVRG